jgi:hypothetical protein|tara:strand:+ start:1172 stop:1468 length:297 start_codon:yes stop_codon:yes gene_type:complete
VKPTKYDRPENWKPPPPKAEPKPKVVKKAPAKKPAMGGDDDDEVMDDVIAPKRAPPRGIGVKPKGRKEAAEDVEMADEEDAPAAPAKKAAARAPPNIG